MRRRVANDRSETQQNLENASTVEVSKSPSLSNVVEESKQNDSFKYFPHIFDKTIYST